jgi:hypothetical protein
MKFLRLGSICLIGTTILFMDLLTFKPVSQAKEASFEENYFPQSQPVKAISNPGDPNLTWETVMQDVNAYKGKRVRWFGQTAIQSSESNLRRTVMRHRTVYMTKGNGTFKDPQYYFIVKYETKHKTGKDFSPFPVWVNATIDGSEEATISPGKGKYGIRKKAPILVDPEFEENKK